MAKSPEDQVLENGIKGMDFSKPATQKELLAMASELATAYVGNHVVDDNDLPDLLDRIYQKLASLNASSPPVAPIPSANGQIQNQYVAQPYGHQRPAVPIEDSVEPDYITCLEDGVRLKMLKRHLRTSYHMTPEQYRAKWGLPPNYPMVAPNYAKVRSFHAKNIGLGRKRSKKTSTAVPQDF